MSVDRLLEALDRVEPGTGDMWLADALWDEFYPQYIEARDALVAKALDPLVVDHVRKAALRSYVEAARSGGDPAEVVGSMLDDFSQMVDVSKAQDQIQRDGWVQYVNRDERGRFSRRAVAGRRTPLATVYNRDRGKIPQAVQESGWTKGHGQGWAEGQNAPTEDQKKQVEQYLADWMQTRNLRAELLKRLDSNTLKNSTLIIHFKDRDTPDKVVPDWSKESGLRNIEHGLYDGRIDSYEVVPDDGLKGQELYDVARSLEAANKMDLLGAQNVSAEQMNAIMSIIDPGSQEATRMSRMTGILQGASELATGVGMKDTGSMLRRAAVATEAGEALRPALTRAAYRYRGTEKSRPDRQFVDAAAFAVQGDDDLRAMEALTRGDRARPLPSDIVRESIAEFDRPVQAPKGGVGRTTELMPRIGQRLKMWQGDPQGRAATTDQMRLGVQRDLVAEEFVRRQTRQFARRTKESTPAGGSIDTGIKPLRNLIQEIANGIGKDLPSEGVVIDANGRVVSQAMGVGGDHYNPFGLKARKALNGGQYIRTRQLGGMTTDDIRTLLTTNARAGTVVSASGVFDLEFDPSFRNQKRLSERALGMVDTYERILDQLAAEGIYARDLDPDKKAALRQEARVRTARTNGDANAEKTLYGQLEAQARKDAMQLTADELEDIKTAVGKIKGLTPRGVADEVQQRIEEKEKEKVRLLSLNGEGYEVALRTLQSYYPYFIRDVSRRGVGDFMDASPAMGEAKLAHNLARAEKAGDKQYVLPGAVRSGSNMQAGAGLPNPKVKVWDPQGISEEAQAAAATERAAARPSGGGGEQPASGGGETSGGGQAPSEPAAAAAAAAAAETPFAMKRVQDRVRNNADKLYRDLVAGIATNAANGEPGLAEELAGEFDALKVMWADDHDATDLVETYQTKGFKGGSDEVGPAGYRRMLDVNNQQRGPEVLRDVANWLGGNAKRYFALKEMLDKHEQLASNGLASNSVLGSLDVAMAMSLAKTPWRGVGEKFNGNPVVIPQLRDATSDDEVRAGLVRAVNESRQGQYAYPGALDAGKLENAAANQEELGERLSTLAQVQRQLRNSNKIDDFLLSGKVGGVPLTEASTEAVVGALEDQNSQEVDDWILIRTGDANIISATEEQRKALLRQAVLESTDRADERRANADTYNSALFAALTLDAAQMAANGLLLAGGGVVPKAWEANSLEPQESLTPEQKALFLVNRVVFGKAQGSRRSPQAVPVARGSRWEALVKEDLARGVPPQVAVLTRTRTSRRSSRS